MLRGRRMSARAPQRKGRERAAESAVPAPCACTSVEARNRAATAGTVARPMPEERSLGVRK